MVLMIDNYDSFTYNIVDLLKRTGQEVVVKRNKSITIDEIELLMPDYIVISPGPGTPDDAGISLQVVRYFAGKIPIMGVCLGHQVIVQAFGGEIVQAPTIMHGKVDILSHDSRGMFRNLEQQMRVVRYHSLTASQGSVPDVLQVTSRAQSDQTIMGVRHRDYQIEGVQFHPESIGTQHGEKLIQNFLSYKREESPVTRILGNLTNGQNLAAADAYEIMDEITNGELSNGQIGAFLGAMAVKGVTSIELSQFASVLINKTGVQPEESALLDTCGTGGDGKHTFNISTASALVCAAAGIKIAKHGNKAVSSKSGSYDFLEALGIPVTQSYERCKKSIDQHNFAFLFAPVFHGAMRFAGQVRQELKVRTVFNMIGPLVNPMRPCYQLTGVFSESILGIYAETLKLLGVKRGMVVHSEDHLDEISICAPTLVKEICEDGEIREYTVDPETLGIDGYLLKDLEGGNAVDNAELFMEIVNGVLSTHKSRAVFEAVALNAGAGLYIAGAAETIEQGYLHACTLITDGAVGKLVNNIQNHEGDA
ncbi:MAG: bifunctional anthranilate synthase component II/anthranilate phosphoribosyltransferase [Spirochaetia bacterium]|nr:bifunctional anthranilate synthase component II/anthranilate phosphoribosyltransferase [Spirochaetia bacterium]